MYMHVLGRGDPVKLAVALHTALAESKTPLSAAPSAPAAAPPPIDLDTAAIDAALGAKGTEIEIELGSVEYQRQRRSASCSHPISGSITASSRTGRHRLGAMSLMVLPPASPRRAWLKARRFLNARRPIAGMVKGTYDYCS